MPQRALARFREPHGQWAVPELRQFLEARNIDARLSSKRSILVKALVKADDKRRFPVLRMPAELRNKIYRFAILQSHRARRERHGMPTYYDETSHASRPHPLLSVSRQIRNEALPVFFTTRRFLLTSVGNHARRFIQNSIRWTSSRSVHTTGKEYPEWIDTMSGEQLATMSSFALEINLKSPSARRQLGIYCRLLVDFRPQDANYSTRLVVSRKTMPWNNKLLSHEPRYRTLNAFDTQERKWMNLEPAVTLARYKTLLKAVETVLHDICKAPGFGHFGREELKRLVAAADYRNLRLSLLDTNGFDSTTMNIELLIFTAVFVTTSNDAT